MTAVREEWDVASMLTSTVPVGSEGGTVDEMREQCGPIIGRVLGYIKDFTGRDLLAELLDPIAGDFRSVSTMQHGWLVLAEASTQVASNHRELATGLAASWEGTAATSAATALADSVERHEKQAQAATYVSEQLGHLVQVAKETANVVCAVLEFLDSLVQELMTDAVLGPIGGVKAGLKAPGKVTKAIRLIDRGIEAVEALRRATQTAIRMLRDVKAALDVANGAVDVLGVGGHLSAGGHLEDTTEAGFR